MSVTRIVDPLRLPSEERARLEAALRSARLSDLRARASIEPLVLAAVCLTGLGVLFARHLGDLPWKLSQHGLFAIVLYALLLFGLALALRSAWRAHRLRDLPQGRVLTPGELLELRGAVLRVRGLEHLEEIREPEAALGFPSSLLPIKLCFSDGTFVVFQVARAERAAVLADLEETADRLRRAYEALDRQTVQSLQLFPDLPPTPEGVGPFRDAPTEHPRFEPPRPRRSDAILAAGFACLAPALWLGRNAVSDELAFDRAARGDSVALWLAYLEGEPRRREDADARLQFARLRQARRHGADGLRSFVRLYPGTAAAEVAARELRAMGR